MRSNQKPDTLMQDRIARIDESSCTARPDHTWGQAGNCEGRNLTHPLAHCRLQPAMTSKNGPGFVDQNRGRPEVPDALPQEGDLGFLDAAGDCLETASTRRSGAR